jgi:transcription elongation factor GreA
MQTRVIHLTAQGIERFGAELNELVSLRRPEVTARLRRAREQSDSDATDYEEARTDQAFVEGRIQELETLLAIAQCIAEAQASELVRLGSRVTLVGLDADDAAETYRIVGSHEADSRHGLVSDASPIGAAVLGCGVGDEVTVQAPGGRFPSAHCRHQLSSLWSWRPSNTPSHGAPTVGRPRRRCSPASAVRRAQVLEDGIASTWVSALALAKRTPRSRNCTVAETVAPTRSSASSRPMAEPRPHRWRAISRWCRAARSHTTRGRVRRRAGAFQRPWLQARQALAGRRGAPGRGDHGHQHGQHPASGKPGGHRRNHHRCQGRGARSRPGHRRGGRGRARRHLAAGAA